MSVRAAMRLTRSGWMFSKDLLTAKGTVSSSSAIRITTHVTIDVTNIVPILLVERVVGDLVEAAPPEHETLLEVETQTFEEEGVLQAAVVLEVGVATERSVQMGHACGEVLG